MEIIIKNNRRILVNEYKKDLDISDGIIIQYTGIYYKPKIESVNIYDMNENECQFIGKIETSRADITGITGIYIIPLYLLDNTTIEWIKIDNYEQPKNKYFLYPHLLMLAEKYYHYKPLYFLHMCEKPNLDDFANVTKTINLYY